MKTYVRTGIVAVATTVALGTAGFAVASASTTSDQGSGDPVVKREDTATQWTQSTNLDDDDLRDDDAPTNHTPTNNTANTAQTKNTVKTVNSAPTKNTPTNNTPTNNTPTNNTPTNNTPTNNTVDTTGTGVSR